MATHNQLVIVVLLESDLIPAWQVQCLAEIAAMPGVQVSGAVFRNNPNRNWLKDAIKDIKRRLFLPRLMQRVAIPQEIDLGEAIHVDTQIDGGRERIPDFCLDQVDALKPDLLIRFGFGIISGRVLDIAPLGVWSFHHGDLRDYRGRPPAFWELMAGEYRVGVTLQKLSEKLDAGEVIIRGHVLAVPWSLNKTLTRLYGISSDLLRNALADARSGNLCPAQPERLGKVYRNPVLKDVLELSRKSAVRFVRWFWEKAFFRPAWRVGIIRSEDSAFKTALPEARGMEWLEAEGGDFIADPFLVPGEPSLGLAELWIRSKQKGIIAGFNPMTPVRGVFPLLEKEYHLSFPQVHEVNGERWLVPEMAQAGFQGAFRFCADSVEQEPLELEGLSGVDPVLFREHGIWWAFTAPRGSEGLFRLNLFFAENFPGPWKPHPANPVVLDPAGARPAGPIFRRADGGLVRVGQRHDWRYGEGVEFFLIKKLSLSEYAETHIGSLVSGASATPVRDAHTFSQNAGVTVIDAFRMKFSWTALIDRFRVRRQHAQRGRAAIK